MSDVLHALKKLRGTLGILANLGLARTFGAYQYSGWNGEVNFARYHWRGRDWLIPTGPTADNKTFAHAVRPKSALWKVPARELTDAQLQSEFASARASFERRGEHGGSPGEWAHERMEEIDLEVSRRSTVMR